MNRRPGPSPRLQGAVNLRRFDFVVHQSIYRLRTPRPLRAPPAT